VEESRNSATELGLSPKVPPKIGIGVPPTPKVSIESNTTLSSAVALNSAAASVTSMYSRLLFLQFHYHPFQ